MKKSIIAEKHISLFQFLLLGSIGSICFIAMFLFDLNFALGIFLILALIPFLYYGYREISDSSEYVREIGISDNCLIVGYATHHKTTRFVKIKLNDIEKCELKIQFYPTEDNSTFDLSQEVCIYHNNNCTKFYVRPTVGIDFRKWSFSIRLLSIARYIPNFSYTIDTNKRGSFIKKDIEYYVANGKKYPYVLLIAADIGFFPVVLLTIIFIAIVICTLFILFE